MSKPTPSGVARLPRRGLAGQECCLNTLILHGGQGGAPLGCLPLWGREGVTLVNQKNLRCQIGFYPAATE
jgi:hypothetical protein